MVAVIAGLIILIIEVIQTKMPLLRSVTQYKKPQAKRLNRFRSADQCCTTL